MEETDPEPIDELQVERDMLEKYWKYVCEEPLASALVPLLQGELVLSATYDEILRRFRGEAHDQVKFLIGYLLKKENVENFQRFWKCVEVASIPGHSLIKKVNEKRAEKGVDAIPTRTAVYFKERQILKDYAKIVCERVKVTDTLPIFSKKLKISQTETMLMRNCKTNFEKMELIMNNLMLKRQAEDHQEFWRCIQQSHPIYHQLVANVDKSRVRFGLPPLYERQPGELKLRVTYSIEANENRDEILPAKQAYVLLYNHVKDKLEKEQICIRSLLRSEEVTCLKVLNGSLCVSVLPENAKALQQMQSSLEDSDFFKRFRESLQIDDFEKQNSVTVSNIKSKVETRDLLKSRDELVKAGQPEDMWYTQQELERMRQQLRSQRQNPEDGDILVSSEWSERYEKFCSRTTDELPGPVEYIEPAAVMSLDATICKHNCSLLACAEKLFGKATNKKVIMKPHEDLETCFFLPGNTMPSHAQVNFYSGEDHLCKYVVQLNVNFNRIYRELHTMGLIVDGGPDAPSKVHGKIIDPNPPPEPEPEPEAESKEETEEQKTEPEKEVKLDDWGNPIMESEDEEEGEEKEKEEETTKEEVEAPAEEEEKEPPKPKIYYKLTEHDSNLLLEKWIWTTVTIEDSKHIVWEDEKPDDEEATQKQEESDTEDALK